MESIPLILRAEENRICMVISKNMWYDFRMYTAVIHEEDGIFVAQCPEVGTVSQGASLQEALSNLQEATNAYLEEFPQSPAAPSFITTFSLSHA